MSLIFGIFDKGGQPVPMAWMQRMKQAIGCWHPDAVDIHLKDNLALACLLRFNTSQSLHSHQPYCDPQSGIIIVFDGRLDNRDQLIEQLGLVGRESFQLSDEILIAKAFFRWRHDCCLHLLGDFVFALWDTLTRQLFLARDHLGVRPLFISETSQFFAFASNKNALLALPWVDKTLNQLWIADLLCITKVDKQQSLYQGVKAFLPAHWMIVKAPNSTQKSLQAHCYWQLDPQTELSLSDDEEYIEQFQALLQQAVSCRLRSHYPIASELSGGLDSTTVTSLASRLLKKANQHPIIACSHVLAPEHVGVFYPYQDEKHWIADLCAFADIKTPIGLTASKQGIIENLQHNAQVHSGPARSDLTQFGDELFASLDQYSARVLLSGFGGDQLVSSHAYCYFEELATASKFNLLWQELRADGKNFIGTGRSWLHWRLRKQIPGIDYLRAASDRLKQSHHLIWQQRLDTLFVNKDFAEQFGYPQRFFDNPALPISRSVRDQEFRLINGAALLYRLEDSAIGAEAAGVEYRYPLLDKRLLEFCLALPSYQKRRSGMARRMLRVSTENLLPENIRWRSDKSRATVPTVHQRRVRDKHRVNEALENMHDKLGDIDCIDWTRLLAFGQRLHKDYHPGVEEKPRAFDRAYQLLYTFYSDVADR